MTIPDQRTESTRELVAELFRRFGDGNLDGALALLSDDFLSHNPRIPHDPATSTGKEAFAAFFETQAGRALAAAQQDIVRVIVEGDHAVVHTRMVTGSTVTAVVDILRVRDDLFVEHWDVVQQVPEPLPHPHGMF
ncbi:nuclear transport factor 2 family protein [Nocardia sp. NPDC052566]|uniref:nuclear transport factor 2 family protein n=1 Tax=Nocardia sp. NPDC052566 TaxID=3364330 RepID=UPI0037C68380